MPGAEKLKSTCFKCKIQKWAVDFKEGSYSKLSATSVCLSCDQGALIEAQKKEIDLLKAREKENNKRIANLEEYVKKIEKLLNEGITNQSGSGKQSLNITKSDSDVKNINGKIDEISNAIKENRDDIIETGKQVVEIREEIALIKTNVNSGKVRHKKSFGPRTKQEVIPLSNRFEVLKDQLDDKAEVKEDEVDDTLEVDSFVIGDSIVREQIYHFAMKNRRQRKTRIVRSFSGCKIKKVYDDLSAIDLRRKSICVIASAGGNDVYGKDKRGGNSEAILEDLTKLVDSLARKTDKGILMGILPRRYASYYEMSKAIGINERISEFCHKKNVDFVDPWKFFFGKWQLFKRDGIHLNEAGHRKLGEILCEAYDKRMIRENQSFKQPQPSPDQIKASTEENTNDFEGFPN